MRAAVMHGRRDIRIESVAVPRPRSGEVLVEVTAVGVCGTDASEWSRGPKLFPINSPHAVTGHHGPMVLGHEFAGIVVGTGAGVSTEWLGKLVASCGSIACGRCEMCQGGRSNTCRSYAAVGLHRDGALARYVSTPVASCVDAGALGVGPVEAALAQPMAIAVHAMRRSRVREGDVAIVQGVGGVGAFLIHALVDAGARVVAIDLDTSRLEVARALGADVVITGGTESARDEIASEIVGRIPVFFEVTGSAPGLRLALDVVPMGTSIVLLGIQKGLSEIDLATITVREIELIGTNAMVRETDFPDAVRLVSLRAGGWGDVVSRSLPLDDLVEGALRPMAEGRPPAIKTLISPHSNHD